MTQPETAPPHRFSLGLVVERRRSASPWQDHVWRPVEAIPGGLGGAWRTLREDAETSVYYAGSFEIELHRTDTEAYRRNLSRQPPLVYVVMRSGPPGGPEMVPFLVTVDPYDAEAYMTAELVEGVPMPAEVIALLRDFVARHHVDRPFVKRKQKPKDQTFMGVDDR